MGSRIYEFLSDSVLFDESILSDDLRTVTAAEIAKELDRYREFCDGLMPELEADVAQVTSPLKMLAAVSITPADVLKQCALYSAQFVVRDPVYQLAFPPPPLPPWAPPGIPAGPIEDPKESLVRALRYLKEISPLVAANYVKPIPMERITPWAPHQSGTVGDVYHAAVPEPILSSLRERVYFIGEDFRNGNNFVFRSAHELGRRPISNLIFIGIEGDEPNVSPIFLNEVYAQTNQLTDSERLFVGGDELQTSLTSMADMAAEQLYNRVLRESAAAERFGASYLARSPTASRVLHQLHSGGQAPIPARTNQALSELSLPFLENISSSELMRIREQEPAPLGAFRSLLERTLKDVAKEDDPTRRQELLRDATHELMQVQVPAVAREVRTIASQLPEAAVVFGGFTALFAKAPWWGQAMAAVGAVGKIAKMVMDARQAPRKHPAFFLWKVYDRSKKLPKRLRG